MEVIKDNSHEVKCDYCESIIRFNNEDVSHEIGKMPFGMWSISYDRYTIKCPICNKIVSVTNKIKK